MKQCIPVLGSLLLLSGCLWTKNVAHDAMLRGGYHVGEEYETLVPMFVVDEDVRPQGVVAEGTNASFVFRTDGTSQRRKSKADLPAGTRIRIEKIVAEYLGTLPGTGTPRKAEPIARVMSGEHTGLQFGLFGISEHDALKDFGPLVYTSKPNPKMLRRVKNTPNKSVQPTPTAVTPRAKE